MKINWFPGHMKKALEEMREELKKADIILYVLDSRAPKSCLNPELEKLSEGKPVLYVLNKIDLTDFSRLEDMKDDFKSANTDYIEMNSKQTGFGTVVCSKIKSLCREKIKKYHDKGVNITIRAMVVGVPNCGKSTLVNNLCKKAKAVTGDRPGVTKGKQWFRIGSGVEVCDTPGTLYPDLKDQEKAKSLAFIGSIRDEILDEVEVADEFIKRLEKLYPGTLEERYKQAKTLKDICKVRAFLLSDGELDLSRGAKTIITDFRKGRLGKIMIEEKIETV